MVFNVNQSALNKARQLDESVDQGLRSYMLKVYNYMAAALGLTGLVAWATSQSPVMLSMLYNADGSMSILGWIIMFAPLGFIFFLGARINKMTFKGAQLAFWCFAAVMGLSLSWIFLAFTAQSITQVFFITSATFLAMSLYGYTTKRNLSGLGSFLFMGLIGIIIASIVNIFMQSSMLQFAISVIGVLVFTGLTAYDTQRIKAMYVYIANSGAAEKGKAAIMAALSLYLDFINLFIMLLQLLGQRR
jgi:hypothetical protein